MTDLEKLQAWLDTYPQHSMLNGWQVDYTDQIPSSGAVFPSGLVEMSRTEDICGNVDVWNQYNFGLYFVFEKAPGDTIGAAVNADWVMDFQCWVQEQSIRHLAPTFGNTDMKSEKISAQNGVLYALPGEGTATYMVQLSVQYKLHFEL